MRILGTASNGTGKDASGVNSVSKFYSTATYDWCAGTWDYTTVDPTKQSAAYSINKVMDLKSPSDKGGYATSSVEVTQDGNLTKLFKLEYNFPIADK